MTQTGTDEQQMQGDSPNSNKSIPLLDRSQPCKIKMDIDITNYLDEFDWEDDVLSRNMVINNVDDNTNHMKRSSINKEKKGRSNIERESEVIGIIIRQALPPQKQKLQKQESAFFNFLKYKDRSHSPNSVEDTSQAFFIRQCDKLARKDSIKCDQQQMISKSVGNKELQQMRRQIKSTQKHQDSRRAFGGDQATSLQAKSKKKNDMADGINQMIQTLQKQFEMKDKIISKLEEMRQQMHQLEEFSQRTELINSMHSLLLQSEEEGDCASVCKSSRVKPKSLNNHNKKLQDENSELKQIISKLQAQIQTKDLQIQKRVLLEIDLNEFVQIKNCLILQLLEKIENTVPINAQERNNYLKTVNTSELTSAKSLAEDLHEPKSYVKNSKTNLLRTTETGSQYERQLQTDSSKIAQLVQKYADKEQNQLIKLHQLFVEHKKVKKSFLSFLGKSEQDFTREYFSQGSHLSCPNLFGVLMENIFSFLEFQQGQMLRKTQKLQQLETWSIEKEMKLAELAQKSAQVQAYNFRLNEVQIALQINISTTIDLKELNTDLLANNKKLSIQITQLKEEISRLLLQKEQTNKLHNTLEKQKQKPTNSHSQLSKSQTSILNNPNTIKLNTDRINSIKTSLGSTQKDDCTIKVKTPSPQHNPKNQTKKLLSFKDRNHNSNTNLHYK